VYKISVVMIVYVNDDDINKKYMNQQMLQATLVAQFRSKQNCSLQRETEMCVVYVDEEMANLSETTLPSRDPNFRRCCSVTQIRVKV